MDGITRLQDYDLEEEDDLESWSKYKKYLRRFLYEMLLKA
jgi:hypothetical protein